MLIDDFRRDDLVSALDTCWRPVSDRVMGGISEPRLVHERHLGRACLRLSGDVRLENGGGFLQMGLDLARDGGSLDAREYAGVRLVVFGNDESYSAHLRTGDVMRPWQSYRARFHAGPEWRELNLAFGEFQPHRIDCDLDLARLSRIGLVAIGRAFRADLRLARIELYR